MNNPEVKQRVLALGEEVVASSPEQFAEFVRRDSARMGRVIKEAGIKLD